MFNVPGTVCFYGAQFAKAEEKPPEKIDFSNVKIEPLFEEIIDFDTLRKSDFRAVKVKE